MSQGRFRGVWRFILKRAVFSLAVLLGVMTLTFLVSRVIIPNPARAWAVGGAGGPVSPQRIAALTAEFHLNDSIWVQYGYYLSDLFQGNWGLDPVSDQPVLYNVGQYLPATVELTIAAVIIMLVIGIPMGVWAATHQDKAPDHVARIVSLSGVASPPFLAALLMQLVFFYYLRVFPDSGGRISPFITPPPQVTGLFTIDSLIAGNIPAFLSALQHLIMPAFALAFLTMGLISRLVRASMLETLSSDYVRTAKAKGLSGRSVVYRHALRNALIQPITATGVYIAYLLGGSVVIELIFSWPGIGRYAATAALTVDLPAVMGTTLAFTIGVVLANLVADILYAFLDPRIRLG